MDPYSAPSLDGLAVAHRAVHGSTGHEGARPGSGHEGARPGSGHEGGWYDAYRPQGFSGHQGQVVAAVPANGFSTHDLEDVPAGADLDWSLDDEPAPAAVEAEPEPTRRGGIGWLAPLVFLLGLFLAGAAAVVAFFAALVVAGAVALWLLLPTAGVSDTDFILVPDTLPAHEDVDAEFILVPDTLPVDDDADAEFILVPDTLPVKGEAPKAPAHEKTTRPARPAPAAQEAPAAPKAQGAAGGKAKVSLEAVPLDEAVRRVKGKAGRGEARSTRGH